ncbi:hypothetical protein EC919_106356 [Pseudomonas graminis]|nr:hypothetical protein EC919_106356 [Pseudomonas graminis]
MLAKASCHSPSRQLIQRLRGQARTYIGFCGVSKFTVMHRTRRSRLAGERVPPATSHAADPTPSRASALLHWFLRRFEVHGYAQNPVGAGLLANASCQSPSRQLIQRLRGQARSYISFSGVSKFTVIHRTRRSRLAGERALPVAFQAADPTPSRASALLHWFLRHFDIHGYPQNPVGAGLLANACCQSPSRQLTQRLRGQALLHWFLRRFEIRGYSTEPVGAGLLANACRQPPPRQLTQRLRGQARTYIGFCGVSKFTVMHRTP